MWQTFGEVIYIWCFEDALWSKVEESLETHKYFFIEPNKWCVLRTG